MKILLSAIACDPFGGSEGIYGWYVVSALAKSHQCSVITHECFRENLVKAASMGLVPDSLSFRYLGDAIPCHPNRLVARIQSWVNYQKFSRNILTKAREWHEEIVFDLAQHVTYTTWRVASPLWKLGIPFIWGPISGTEIFPSSCRGSLSFQARCFEILRSIQTWFGTRNHAVGKCLRNACVIPVPHKQAYEFLSNLRGTDHGVEVCHNFFFPYSRMESLNTERPVVVVKRRLRAFGAGNLEGRKGIAIALMAIAIAKERGVRVEYRVTSQGPELSHLNKLSNKLGLADQVVLGERFEPSEFAEALGTFDICLVPSLRDGAGLSIMEAMLAGCVPIVADWCGPAEFVTEECGYKVAVTDPKRMAEEIAGILCHLDKNREEMRQLGVAARNRIRIAYSEEQFLQSMNCIYKEALDHCDTYDNG